MIIGKNYIALINFQPDHFYYQQDEIKHMC